MMTGNRLGRLVILTAFSSWILPTNAQGWKRKLGSNQWDVIHEQIQGQKRDATVCSADYYLCPQSVSGGCCPTDRSCGVSSCYATTTAPSSACGMLGYVACGIDEGGGCCPSGYSCAQAGCAPMAGATATITCPASHYECAASLGGGCCLSGLGCAVNGCYSTAPTTWSTTVTTTEVDATTTRAVTTVVQTAYTPSIPTDVITSADIVAKITPTPTAVAKEAAAESSSSSSGSSGLTKGDLAGIVTAGVVILLVVIFACIIVVRRLNNAAEESRTASSSRHYYPASDPRSRSSTQTGYASHHTRNVDSMSYNPLIPNDGSGPARNPSRRPGRPHRSRWYSYSSSTHSGDNRYSVDQSSTYSGPSMNTYDQVYYPDAAMREQYAMQNQQQPTTYYGAGASSRPATHGRQYSDTSQVTFVSLESPVSPPDPPVELEGSSPTDTYFPHNAIPGDGNGSKTTDSRRRSSGSAILERFVPGFVRIPSTRVARQPSNATEVSAASRKRSNTRDSDDITVSPSSPILGLIGNPFGSWPSSSSTRQQQTQQKESSQVVEKPLQMMERQRREGERVAIPSTVLEALEGREGEHERLGAGIGDGSGTFGKRL